jgi:phage tail sheath gpL-like
MTLFSLSGLTGDDKVPGNYSENKFGQGRRVATLPSSVVLTGNMTSDGSMTPDLDVVEVFGETEAAALAGARSELMQQYLAAAGTGASIFFAPPASPDGGVQATLVVNFESLGTGVGSAKLHFGDNTVEFSIDTTSAQQTATNLANAVNGKAHGFCVASVGGATEYDVTLTVASPGERGNSWLAKLDMSKAPTGCVITLGPTQDNDGVKVAIATSSSSASYSGADINGALASGGVATIDPPRFATATLSASVGSYVAGSTITFTGTFDGSPVTDVLTITGADGGEVLVGDQYFDTITQIDIEAQVNTSGEFLFGVYSQAEQTASGWTRFYGGVGTDDVSNIIDLMEAEEYARIGSAQNDATNAARWEAHADSESAPLINHKEQVVLGHTGTLTEVTSLAQTTLNAYLCAVYAQRNSRKHPAQIAAKVAAQRAAAESNDPWTRYDGEFNDAGAQLWTDVPAHATDRWNHAELKALLNAGVSPVNDFNGDTRIVRSICSHCLNGSDPDYRCLDTADVTVPQYVRVRMGTLAQSYLEENPGVGPDLPDGQPQIEGVGTPRVWNALVLADLKDVEKIGYLKSVDANPPVSEYDDDTDRINTVVPCVVRKHQHQMAQSVRQIAG